jgi:hypothetical protein
MSCHVCALQCHVRFPSHSCRHADGCRRMAADCALPGAVAESRGCRVSNSHSATECPRCRPRTVGDMHSTRLPPSSPPATTRRRTAGPPPGPRPPEAPPRVRDPAPARGHGATSRRVSRGSPSRKIVVKKSLEYSSFNRVSLATPHRGLARVAKAQIVSPRSRHRERAATAHRGDTGAKDARRRGHTQDASHTVGALHNAASAGPPRQTMPQANRHLLLSSNRRSMLMARRARYMRTRRRHQETPAGS